MRMVCTTSMQLGSQGEWTGMRMTMTCREPWQFHLISWHCRMHVYCVAVTCKVTERVEQQICSKFYFKLEHPSVETIWMIQKATALGNWWWQLHRDNAPAHASRLVWRFLAKHQIAQVTQPPTAQIWHPSTLGFFQN